MLLSKYFLVQSPSPIIIFIAAVYGLRRSAPKILKFQRVGSHFLENCPFSLQNSKIFTNTAKLHEIQINSKNSISKKSNYFSLQPLKIPLNSTNFRIPSAKNSPKFQQWLYSRVLITYSSDGVIRAQ